MRNPYLPIILVALLMKIASPADLAAAEAFREPSRLLEVPTITRYEVKYRFARLELFNFRGFDQGRPYAISINARLPSASRDRARMVERLQQRKQLDRIVFDWFGTGTGEPKRLNLSIGSEVPVEVAQAAIEAYALGAKCPVFIQVMEEDKGFAETHRIYIGGLVDFGKRSTPPEAVLSVLEAGLTRKQFARRLREPTIH